MAAAGSSAAQITSHDLERLMALHKPMGTTTYLIRAGDLLRESISRNRAIASSSLSKSAGSDLGIGHGSDLARHHDRRIFNHSSQEIEL
jgi:hypothetical protein